MQHATAIERRGRIFVRADSKTVHGLWIQSDPVLEVDPHNPAELGRAVLSALAGSKEGVAHPSIWEGVPDRLPELAGVKSSNTFYASTRCVVIKCQSDCVTFTPYRNLGAKEGHEPLTGKDRTSSLDSSEIGTALLSAFQDAE
jgi:hypothetical protein